MKLLKVTTPGHTPGSPVALRCPGCRHQATFQPLGNVSDFRIEQGIFGGQRVCSTPDCNTHVFVLHDGVAVLEAYPPELIDFDPTGIPDGIRDTLAEALNCHANGCYRAAAMMVRRTLEELCEHQGVPSTDTETKNSTSLKARLDGLKDVVVLPGALFEALHDLRLLGNDAAHVVSKDYDNVGQNEVEIAVDVTKEILKAVYQLDHIVSRLRALQKPTT